ncbi:hypothetical protein [Bacillus tequilensis]|uniref:Uncharacterized protein n=1 Tax=Bacillus tequilensis TaxID=227866 RepID=A0A6H0WHC3_9BACI|nr:hypothetical protein [Bacillus tequilensis]QIW79941.1 hypothetical protein G4P54_09025 [Bacillus tequilensis]
MFYKIGIIENMNEYGSLNLKTTREFTQEEYTKYVKTVDYLALHLKNKHLYELIVRNGEELEKFLETFKDKNPTPATLGNPGNILFEANRLLMNYLSMVRTYNDLIPSALSKTLNSDVKKGFEKILSKMYDDFFEFRFLIRLRNYAQHFNIPFTSIIPGYDGLQVAINQRELLKYSGWSAVKEEIEEMEESIVIDGFAQTMNKIMKEVFVQTTKFYIKYITDSGEWISSLQKEVGGEELVLVYSYSEELFEEGIVKFSIMQSPDYIEAMDELKRLS